MDFAVIGESWPLYLEGLITTAQLVIVSLLIGLAMAVPLGILHTMRNPLIRWPVWFYVYVFRGTPLLVQLYLIYYGAAQFEFIRDGFLWPILREPHSCALIAFTLNTAAYTTEIIRGSITTAPHGEIEAARAFGMSPPAMMWRIILPGAFRRALPAYGNEVIFMLHGSAVASVITIVDLLGAARIVNSRFYTPYEAFLTAGALYLVLTFVIVGAFKLLENRMLRHLRRQPA